MSLQQEFVTKNPEAEFVVGCNNNRVSLGFSS